MAKSSIASASKPVPEPLSVKELPDVVQKASKSWIEPMGKADAKQTVADEMRRQADLIAKPLKKSAIVWAGN